MADPKRKATKLVKLVINEISLVDRGANPGARMLLMKRDAGDPGLTGVPIMADKTVAPTLEDLDKAVKAAEAANTTVLAEKAKLEAEATELRKQLADATAAAAAKTELEKSDLTKRLEAETAARVDMEKRLASLIEKDELASYVTKAADYKHLPMTAAELAPVLRDVAKLPEASAAAIHKALSATSEALGKALDALPFVRSDAPAGPGASEFQNLVNKRMAEKGEDEAKATDEVAKTEAGRQAYRRMVAEQRAN